MSGEDRLADLAARIDRLSTDPARVRDRWAWAFRPVLRAMGWQATFEVKAIEALLATLRSPSPYSGGPLLRAAIEEIAANVAMAERATVLEGALPTARIAWLHRLHEIVTRAARAAGTSAASVERRAAAALDPVLAAPPLILTGPAPDAATVDLSLGSIDALLDAARSEDAFLGRRRRLLEAARKLLLDAAAALPLEPAGVEARRQHIAEQIVRIDRLEGAGIAPTVGLLHQATSAVSRGDRQRAYAALAAIDGFALARGDLVTAQRTGKAIRLLSGRRDPSDAKTRAASLSRSAVELLGEEVVLRVRAAYEAARGDFAAKDPQKRAEQSYLGAYFDDEPDLATLSAALGVDGCFEVGGPLSPVRVVEHETRLRAVSFPTPELVLLPARDIGDVPAAVIEDPRRILLALAEGRLLTRKYVREEVVSRAHTELRSEARIYLLDGSGSMLNGGSGRACGARARMRDAILVAELATLRRRFTQEGGRARVVLWYRYFDSSLGPIARVDSATSALDAISSVLRATHEGGTDIEGALLASFEQLRQAREEDPELAEAQIVLVTDGEAEVRPEVIQREREALGELSIGVSVIALGEENPSLREIVARQRARGERAFYHHLDDATLQAMAGGAIDRGPAVHLLDPFDGDRQRSAAEVASELGRDLGGLLDELGALDRKHHAEALETAAEEARALAEVGLDASSLSEGERARRELLDRDRQALEARFARWFPPPREPDPGDLPPDARDREALDQLTILLSAVAEVVADLGGSPLARRADAIEIFERLLSEARLSPARYHALLRAYPSEVREALLAVRD